VVQFGIIDHNNFTIVGADGHYTKPHTESYMQVSTGQRFEVILKAKTAEELNGKTDYLIQFETKDRPTVYHGYGVLRYYGASSSITRAPAEPSLTLSNATYDWLEYTFWSL
jgi:FtsP/CotA-like multicopper oxidase with cupredoxin domain